MYNVAPIQTVGELSCQTSDNMSDESAVMARLDALQSRVNTIKSVLAKTPKKTDFGSKFIQKVAPLDIVVNVNPAVNSPHGWYYSWIIMTHNYIYNRIYLKGLECLHRQLSSQFKVLTKSHVHSTATGTKCDLFKNSPLGTKDTRKGIWDHQYATDEDGPIDSNWWLRGLFICGSSFVDLLTDYQIIFTVIYTCATDDLTAFIGNSRLTGISSVTRFIGRILDIYPPQVNIPILFNCYIFRSRMSKSKIIWIWQILLVILIHQRKRKWQTQRFWINTLQRKRYFSINNMPWQHFL